MVSSLRLSLEYYCSSFCCVTSCDQILCYIRALTTFLFTLFQVSTLDDYLHAVKNTH